LKETDAKESLAALDAVVAALAHPARRQILLTIHMRGGESTAGDLANRFAHAWPTTTRHLGILVEAGLLKQERAGRHRIYEVDHARLGVLEEWLGWFRKPPGA